MAMVNDIIGWVAGAISGVGNMVGGGVAWDATKKDLDYQEQTNQEKYRRQELEKADLLGSATAAANASGVDGGSASISNYIGSMKSEMDRQSAWTRAADERALSNARTANDWKFAGTVLSFFSANLSTNFGDMSETGKKQGNEYDEVWTEYNTDWNKGEWGKGAYDGQAGPGGSTYSELQGGFKLED
jgi:hypothetical protein